MRDFLGRYPMVVVAVAASLFLITVLLQQQASANLVMPRAPPDTTFRLTEPVSGIAWLFVVNIIVNLLLYSGLLLLTVRKNPHDRGLMHASTLRFFVALVGAVIAITLVGAFVDYYLVAQPRYLDGIYDHFGRDISGVYRVVSLDMVNWVLALAIISLSVIAISVIVLKLDLRASTMVASGIAFANVVFWLLIGVFGEDVTFLTIIFGMLVSPVIVRALTLWYANERPLRTRDAAEMDPTPLPTE